MYEAVTRRAIDLGVSRWQFLVTAAWHYLGELGAVVVTRRLAVDDGRSRLTGDADW